MAYRPDSAREKSTCSACAPKQIVAITSCNGCSQNFCRKHFNEHRDQLSTDLQTVFGQHDHLLQEVQMQLERPSNPLNSGPAADLLKRIEDWKKATILSVTRAAGEASAHVQRLFSRKQDMDQLKTRVDDITRELKKQQESESFVETDIDRWTEHLRRIQAELSQPPPIFKNPPQLQVQDVNWNTIIRVSTRHESFAEPVKPSEKRNDSSTLHVVVY